MTLNYSAKNLLNKNYNLIEHLIVIVYSFVIFNSMTICFECDGTTYLNFAKSLATGESFNLLRGPIYPVFLILTGSVWPGTLIITLFIQWLMGVISILLILKLLKSQPIFLRFIFLILATTTSFTFFGAKILLAEQLTMFLCVVASVMYINLPKDKILFHKYIIISISAILAFLTRYEALPFLLILTFLLFLKLCRKGNFAKSILIVCIPIFVVAQWNIYKSIQNDMKLNLFKVASESGVQLLWSVNFATVITQIDDSASKPDEIVSIGALQGYDCTQPTLCNNAFFSPSNGPTTREVIRIVKQSLDKNREPFESKVFGLAQDKSYESEMNRIWQPASNDPGKVVDWFFSSDTDRRSTQTILLMNEVLKQEVGIENSDKLLRRVAIEAVVSHPILLRQYLNLFLKWFGIDLKNREFFFTKNTSIDYWKVPFNLANCAGVAMTTNQFEEYKFIFSINDPNSNIEKITSNSMQISRIIYLLLIIFWSWNKINRKVLDSSQVYVFIVAYTSTVSFMTVSQVNISSKYSILPGSLMLISIATIINSLNRSKY